ncbi:UbiA prenyltransferase family protein [Sphingobacterium hungaricum]
MKVIHKISDFFIFSNLLIASAALAQCALTYLIFNQEINYDILGIETTATLLLYNFSILLSKPKNPQNSIYARTRWIFKYTYVIWTSSLLSMLLMIYFTFQISFESFLFLGAIGAFSLLYAIPVVRYKGVKIGLRNIPFVKLFHIAFIWTCSSVILPVIELTAEGIHVDLDQVIYLSVMKFLFLIICTLPFDIRDFKQDSSYNLITIPTYFGIEKAKMINYVLLIVHSGLIVLSPFELDVKIGLLFTNALICIFLKQYVFKGVNEYNKVYLLDAFLVVQFLLVYASMMIY